MELVRYLAAILIAYLLGAIPTGLLVGKLIKGVDLREFGSGKTGATNALRTLGKVPAALVLLGDLLKGIAAILVAHFLTDGNLSAECLAGLAAAVGHNWPVYAGFRGGRGVVVSYGIFWVLCWPAALVSSCVGLSLIAASLIVSLGVLVGSVVGLLAAILFVIAGFFSPWVLLYVGLGTLLIIVRHWDNIERLRAGTERKIGQPAQPVV
jgi:glycerol-3-phosphate acyltransferase PlsY